MKKMNKKGFTIVELVIVIAVIAILAGVLIPTFSGIVEKAQVSAEQQKITNAYKEAYAIALVDGNGTIKDGAVDPVNDIVFNFDFNESTGVITDVTVDNAPDKSAIDANKYVYDYVPATNTFTVTVVE